MFVVLRAVEALLHQRVCPVTTICLSIPRINRLSKEFLPSKNIVEKLMRLNASCSCAKKRVPGGGKRLPFDTLHE